MIYRMQTITAVLYIQKFTEYLSIFCSSFTYLTQERGDSIDMITCELTID